MNLQESVSCAADEQEAELQAIEASFTRLSNQDTEIMDQFKNLQKIVLDSLGGVLAQYVCIFLHSPYLFSPLSALD